jgi:hypothetical protein
LEGRTPRSAGRCTAVFSYPVAAQGVEAIVEGVKFRPINLSELRAALSLCRARLLLRKERDRIAKYLFFWQLKYLRRFKSLLPQVARVVPEVLPMAAIGHVVPVEI